MTSHHAADFDHVQTWIFDLDNTLYPAHCNLFDQVDQKMGEFISRFLDVDRVEARRMQKKYYHEYGTTLSGLMNCHGMEPGPFLDFVHDIDHTAIPVDHDLNDTLSRLEGDKYVFTNGSVRHAENVMNRIGITHHFLDIFDIVAADYVPKPEARTYEKFLAATGIESASSAMFEDISKNLICPHDLGMKTVLVRSPEERRADHSNEWDGVGADEPHVHHVTDDLVRFLQPLTLDRA